MSWALRSAAGSRTRRGLAADIDATIAAGISGAPAWGVYPVGWQLLSPPGRRALAHLAERHITVDRRFARKSEDALADEISLNLIASPADRVLEGTHRR